MLPPDQTILFGLICLLPGIYTLANRKALARGWEDRFKLYPNWLRNILGLRESELWRAIAIGAGFILIGVTVIAIGVARLLGALG
jgi:hypothetical protein